MSASFKSRRMEAKISEPGWVHQDLPFREQGDCIILGVGGAKPFVMIDGYGRLDRSSYAISEFLVIARDSQIREIIGKTRRALTRPETLNVDGP